MPVKEFRALKVIGFRDDMHDLQNWARVILAWPYYEAISYNEYLRRVTAWMNGEGTHPLDELMVLGLLRD